MSELISGKEALSALMIGETVEMMDSDADIPWTEICVRNNDFFGKIEPCIWMFINTPNHIQFRLKPQTITINGSELSIPPVIETQGELELILKFNKISDRNVFLNTLQNRHF